MKVTKKPKKVIVSQRPVQAYISSYACPTCKVNFVGAGVGLHVTRFKCSCGQELIVEHDYREVLKEPNEETK